MAPEAIAAAIRSILDLSLADRRMWRDRLAAMARERYSWPIAAEAYKSVLRSLNQAAPSRS